jgi:hypothetical protein
MHTPFHPPTKPKNHGKVFLTVAEFFRGLVPHGGFGIAICQDGKVW